MDQATLRLGDVEVSGGLLAAVRLLRMELGDGSAVPFPRR